MALPPITITMLGAGKSGKTCYMVGMYALMQAGYEAFTFSTDEDTATDLMDAWFQLMGTGHDRWPAATSLEELKQYSFSFRHAFRKIIDFTWVDYRGNALVRGSSFGPDVKALAERAATSTVIMFCISAEHLNSGHATASVSLITGAGRMGNILSAIRDSKGAETPPVAIVVTQHDRVHDTMSPMAIVARLRELFAPLFVPGGGWHVAICPVSLGEEVAEKMDKGDDGMMNPYNMHVPVFFAADCMLRRHVAELSSEMSHRRSRAASLGDNAVKRWWNSDSIDYLQSVNNESAHEIARLRADMDRIMSDLKILTVFEDGVETRPYD